MNKEVIGKNLFDKEPILTNQKSPEIIGIAKEAYLEYKKLQQENKQLKENLKNTYETSQELLAEKQKIINKAIEYINENSHYYNADGEIKFTIEEEKEETFCKDLLEILKGESNE